MALATPFLPGLPDLAPRPNGRRRCASVLTQAYAVTPLLQPEPTPRLCDFLTFWYMRVWQDGEHAALWGEVGLSPSHCVLTFAHVPLVLVHAAHRPWEDAAGLMMAVWLDDIVPGLRARVHQWVAPPYRHPHVSQALGQAVLQVLFEGAGFHLLEGRTPVGNRGGIRYARRLGFRLVATLPYGEWTWTPEGTKTRTAVVQSQLTVEEWRQRQQTEGDPDGVPL